MALFFDLSIPYLERDGLAPPGDKLLWEARLRTVARAVELGYAAVAYDRPLRGTVAELHRCRIPPLRLDPLLERAPALAASASLHRACLGAPAAAPFRQYTRVTVLLDGRAAAVALASARAILRTYDIVAARPTNQEAFNEACTNSDIDLIAIDFSQKLPFRLKLSMVEAAIKRSVHFEITYSHLIADVYVRRQMISDARILVDWTRGKNLIISSAASTANDLRGPHDVANLSAFLLGLSMERAKAALSRNCRSLVANALRKKHCYKEAIRIERILPDKQPDPKGVWFGDWNNWDPISSGEGELPPLEKLSAVSKSKNSLAISLMSVSDETSVGDRIFRIGDSLLSVGNKKTTSFSNNLESRDLANEVLSASTDKITTQDSLNVFSGTLLTDMTHFKPQIPGGECDLDPAPDMAMLPANAKKAGQIVVKDDNPRCLDGSDMVSDESRTLFKFQDSIFASKGMVPPDNNPRHSENNQVPEACMEDHNSSDQPDANSGATETLQINTGFQVCIPNVASDQTSLKDVSTLSKCIMLPNLMHSTLHENIRVSEACMEDLKSSDVPDVNSDAIEASHIVAEFQKSIPGVACDQTSLNDFQASFTTSMEYNMSKEQVGARTEDCDQKDEVSCSCGINLQMDFVECLGELKEIAIPITYGMPMAHTYEEIQEKEKGRDTSVETDAQPKDPVVKIEQQKQVGVAAIDGAGVYKLQKGKRRREEGTNQAYPLPMKSFLKRMFFKKNVGRFRRLRKHKELSLFLSFIMNWCPEANKYGIW